jgi:hypothetical protein
MKAHSHELTTTNWQPRRLIAFGYDDGPTEGIVDMGRHGAYCFKVMAMDSAQELRALRLAELAEERFDTVANLISAALGPPTWPVWVPIWNFAKDEDRVDTESRIDAICASGTIVGAALCDDTLQRCFLVRDLDETTSDRLTDWLSFLK